MRKTIVAVAVTLAAAAAWAEPPKSHPADVDPLFLLSYFLFFSVLQSFLRQGAHVKRNQRHLLQHLSSHIQ